ncbi:hypothetical protein FOZG_01248 [Fusarium oxysporum Fo47]|uniref:Uncharacterized protein n=1 Tax=Fusarium oxysporum Fo47 TaxID=660027 RepID=W9L2J9_FUSOX|nr:hypothetical protein FOZG_01248 [Fusarium oxysporum Fo47]
MGSRCHCVVNVVTLVTGALTHITLVGGFSNYRQPNYLRAFCAMSSVLFPRITFDTTGPCASSLAIGPDLTLLRTGLCISACQENGSQFIYVPLSSDLCALVPQGPPESGTACVTRNRRPLWAPISALSTSHTTRDLVID